VQDNVADKHSYEGYEKIEIPENVYVSKNEVEYEIDQKGCVTEVNH
jgi:hypothetical protein